MTEKEQEFDTLMSQDVRIIDNNKLIAVVVAAGECDK